MSNSLTGKVALVTGGSRGLGAAVALALAEEGAEVAITYEKSKERADAVVAQIQQRGRRAVAIQSDQGDPSTAELLITKVVEHLGKLDILVNNAAVAWQGARIDDPEIDNSAMDRQWAINVSGVVANIRSASKVLPEGGRIISVGSGVGTRAGFPGTADYAGTKAALIGYSKGAARDLGLGRSPSTSCRLASWRPTCWRVLKTSCPPASSTFMPSGGSQRWRRWRPASFSSQARPRAT